jgi:hypothetical protein
MGVYMSLTGYPDPEVLNVVDTIKEEDVYVLVKVFGIPVHYIILDSESPIPRKHGKVLLYGSREPSSFRRILLWKKEIVKDGWESKYVLSAVIDPEDKNHLLGLSTVDRMEQLHRPRNVLEVETMLIFDPMQIKVVKAGYKYGEEVYREEDEMSYAPESKYLVQRLAGWVKQHKEYQRWLEALTTGVK